MPILFLSKKELDTLLEDLDKTQHTNYVASIVDYIRSVKKANDIDLTRNFVIIKENASPISISDLEE